VERWRGDTWGLKGAKLSISLVLSLVKMNFCLCESVDMLTGAREWSLIDGIKPAQRVYSCYARCGALRYAFHHLERAEDGNWKESVQGPVGSFFRG